MTVLPVERLGPMHSPFHPDPDAADHLSPDSQGSPDSLDSLDSLDTNELRLVAQPVAASEARDFTRAQLRTWGLEELSELCVLVVSEMTTNAIKATATPPVPYGYTHPPAPGHPHASGHSPVPGHPHTSDRPPGSGHSRTAGPYPILLRLHLTTEGLRVEVWDSSDDSPELTEAGEDDESGRGLLLVGMCADEWGHHPSPGGGKVVFARWDLPPARRIPATPPSRPYAYSRTRATRG
ncbi:ATP-binding protein [Streptosporangium sp. NPDC000509]|uniref:ATP-binding protein n=1 Tax=Streptosporangium sp. NPDC000509 TaxID=3366186 RepID=UPI00369DE089